LLAGSADGNDCSDDSHGAHLLSLEECLWRWTDVMDATGAAQLAQQDPSKPNRASKSWAFQARLLQQSIHADRAAPQILSIARRLLTRITADMPAQDVDVRRIIQLLFSRCELEPGFPDFLCTLMGDAHACDGASNNGVSTDQYARVAPRVALIAKSILPSYKGLHEKLASKITVSDEANPQLDTNESEEAIAHRSVVTIPTPQQTVIKRFGSLAEETIIGSDHLDEFAAAAPSSMGDSTLLRKCFRRGVSTAGSATGSRPEFEEDDEATP